MFDLWRSLLLVAGGLLIGFTLVEARLYYERWRVNRFDRFRWIIALRLASAVGILFVTLEVAQRLGDDLSYRAPLASVAYALLFVGLLGVLRDDQRQQDGEYPLRRRSDHG